MSRMVGAVAIVVVGAMLLLVIPFLWLGADSARGLPVVISLEGVDLGVVNDHIPGGKLDREQAANAYYIVYTAVWTTGNRRAATIAVATALQESALHNVDHGDKPKDSGELGSTSRGLYQQMTQFYGGEAAAMDPFTATQAFIKRLMAVPNWESLPLTDAAQAVQRSAFPDEYADEEPAAQRIVDLLWDPIVSAGPAGQAALVGGYALPISPDWFRAHPEWLSQPHHDYPSADIPVPAGTPVYAVVGGVVLASPAGGDCGNGVVIQGDDGLIYTYCHGDTPLVPRGVRVPVGQAIMISGWSGHVEPPSPAGAHLHLQIQRGPGGPLVCPQPALQAWSQGDDFSPAALPEQGCVG